jgi:hypothetical protein
MKAHLTFLIFIFIFLFVSTAVSAQEKYIAIGSGGGVTGSATVFKITPDGKVYKGHGLGEIKYTECSKLKKSRTKKIFTKASQHVKAAGEFNHPGNMYYFVTLSEGNKPQRITWGDAGHPVNEDLKNLYTEIQTTVSALKYKPVK